MKLRLLITLLCIAWCSSRAAVAHRLDEYLQAATVKLDAHHVTLRLRLTPGVQVIDTILAAIDTNHDGFLSDAEQIAYAQHVLQDLTLVIDDHPAPLACTSSTFPSVDEMREGLGEIVLTFDALVPEGIAQRKLIFQNHHQPPISVYLVNCLAPTDHTLAITAQDRTYDQSSYQLHYTQAATAGATASTPPASASQTGRLSLFEAFIRLGIHHILTGYDHLLVVTALLLAATTLWNVVKVVSAFTLAHTLTLTLAALNIIHVPSQIVEPLIAASIVVIALQNLFWPTRARGWSRLAAAFFFGLFHGLGFAGGLLEAMQQMHGTTMLLAILAFSIGVEAGHQMVVLPLFALLKWARSAPPDLVTRARLSMTVQRVGSAAISMAGLYYLCIAIVH